MTESRPLTPFNVLGSTTMPAPPAVRWVTLNVTDAEIVEDHPPNDTRDIYLPNHIDKVSHIALDIGGSLAKVVYFSKNINGPGGRLNFTKFETSQIDDCIEFIDKLHRDARRKSLTQLMTNTTDDSTSEEPSIHMQIMCTGGGAHKFYDKLRNTLHVPVQKEDEMECLIEGLNFLITKIPNEVFTYSEANPMQFEPKGDDIFPYMLVNIGSGVSIIKVDGPGQFQRISGTSLGGGTLWGLLSLLTPAQTFDEMLEMSVQGDNGNVDMLVGDIYGKEYAKIGLKSTAIASSLGKVFRKGKGRTRQPQGQQDDKVESTMYRAEDISRSLLYAISNNIGQIAYLNAERHGIERIYFGGSFIRGHTITMNTLTYAIRFWSNGTKKAFFVRHEGYIGSIGAFVKHYPLLREIK